MVSHSVFSSPSTRCVINGAGFDRKNENSRQVSRTRGLRLGASVIDQQQIIGRTSTISVYALVCHRPGSYSAIR